VLAASTFGTPPPLAHREAWEASARRAGVPLLVDSAAGFGATDERGERLGRQGDAEVFSFHATKPFAIGEGGLVTTADQMLAERLRRLTNFGLSDGAVGEDVGLNAKLAEWPAATALAVLDRYAGVLDARRASAEAMLAELEPLGFARQAGARGAAWQFVPVLAPTLDVRAAALAQAKHDGIELRTYFSVPLHRMPAFAAARVAGDLRHTDELAARILSLPMANDLSGDAVAAIVSSLAAARCDGARRTVPSASGRRVMP
jgi:dTDP-4-amino-4,6-dideoxygalactose transaminase